MQIVNSSFDKADLCWFWRRNFVFLQETGATGDSYPSSAKPQLCFCSLFADNLPERGNNKSDSARRYILWARFYLHALINSAFLLLRVNAPNICFHVLPYNRLKFNYKEKRSLTTPAWKERLTQRSWFCVHLRLLKAHLENATSDSQLLGR